MEIKLPIYEKKEIVKTYTAETYDIMFGTVEDLISIVEIDKFFGVSDKEFALEVAKIIPKIFGLVKPLLKDIFDGLTDDELKHCKITDVVNVIVAVIKYSMSQVIIDGSEKN